jgi:hypothetical protein
MFAFTYIELLFLALSGLCRISPEALVRGN